ncbi:MAG: hypothetical protein MR965_11110 [Lachnospiraceae bacterium]|nr:hypothetical protein [Lachnospiraceae bacterium]
MTKFEFLGDLSRLIADLPQEEIEQAMEYYEDYFADAGPEKEQEIIRDFISPAYIAEQLREASLQRQKAAAQSTFQEEEKQAAAARAAAASGKPAVFSRKLAAQAQKNASMTTASGFVTQTPTVKSASATASPVSNAGQAAVPQPAAKTIPGNPAAAIAGTRPTAPAYQNNMVQQPVRTAPNAAATVSGAALTPAQAAAAAVNTIPVTQPVNPTVGTSSTPTAQAGVRQTSVPQHQQAPAGAPQSASAAPTAKPAQPSKASAMRNSIFRDDTEDDKKKAEHERELKNKTKVDIKSINSTTSKVNKKQSRAEAKKNAAIEKANNAERYSSSKKLIIGIVLLVTCPIWLIFVGIFLGVFALGICGVVVSLVAGIGCFAASLSSIALTILALISAKISTGIFTLGCVFFLAAAGIGLCFFSYKLVTRILPGAYFSTKVLFTGIKARLARMAMK